MQKNLSERISERIMKSTTSRHAQSRAIFLALRSDIEQALQDGWSIKNIWETLKEEGKINFSYESFRLHINALIRSPKNLKLENKSEKINPKKNNFENVISENQESQIEKTESTKSFIFNPIPNREDLI